MAPDTGNAVTETRSDELLVVSQDAVRLDSGRPEYRARLMIGGSAFDLEPAAVRYRRRHGITWQRSRTERMPLRGRVR
jgi:hypothetical protein